MKDLGHLLKEWHHGLKEESKSTACPPLLLTAAAYFSAFTTAAKIGFAQAPALRGYFFWALSYDSDWKISAQASKSWILDE